MEPVKNCFELYRRTVGYLPDLSHLSVAAQIRIAEMCLEVIENKRPPITRSDIDSASKTDVMFLDEF